MLCDLHSASFGKDNSMLIAKVKSLSPDIILCGGDMINSYTKDLSCLKELYSKLSTIAPVYSVLGNHEVNHTELNEIKKIMNGTNCTLLDDEQEDIYIKGNLITIAGTSFYRSWDEEDNAFYKDFAKSPGFKLFLCHFPEYYLWGIKNYPIDLTLCGHTHGGQVILPFADGLYAPEQNFFPEYDYGCFQEEHGTLIISRGLGSSDQILPRYNNPPEILNITIAPEV